MAASGASSDTAEVDRPHAVSRRTLAFSSSGGHFKQLISLVGRIPGLGDVTWVTYDAGLSQDLLTAAGRSADRLEFVPYAAPRDVRNLARDGRALGHLLRHDRFDLAVSTGAGFAVAGLPLARAHGLRAVFIESATRSEAPSLSGRILHRIPGVETCSQYPGFGKGWRCVGSVHDEFEPGPLRASSRPIARVVVTLGTIAPYGFRRLLERLVEILPPDTEVLWQTGSTGTAGLRIEARDRVPAPELEQAMSEADVVVAHAGTGTALTAFELGVHPVLVPRRRAHDEHIDDHQVATARALAARGLATYVEARELDIMRLSDAARRSVQRRHDPPLLDL